MISVSGSSEPAERFGLQSSWPNDLLRNTRVIRRTVTTTMKRTIQTILVMVMRNPTPTGLMRLLTCPFGACIAGVRLEAIVVVEWQQGQAGSGFCLDGQGIQKRHYPRRRDRKRESDYEQRDSRAISLVFCSRRPSTFHTHASLVLL
jgi:hypothetical protein